MIDQERKHFEEIVERGRRGAFLGDDFEWLVAELDSYSKAWKTGREDLRKLSDVNIAMARRHELLINTLQMLVGRIRSIGGLENEARAAEAVLKEGQ